MKKSALSFSMARSSWRQSFDWAEAADQISSATTVVAVTLETPRMACSASMTARIAAGACDGRRRGAWALAHDSRGLPRLRPREGGAWVSPVQIPVGRGQACYGVAEHWREQRRELGAAFARHRPCRRGADCRCLYPGVCVGHRRLVCGATSLLLQRQQRPLLPVPPLRPADHARLRLPIRRRNVECHGRHLPAVRRWKPRWLGGCRRHG